MYIHIEPCYQAVARISIFPLERTLSRARCWQCNIYKWIVGRNLSYTAGIVNDCAPKREKETERRAERTNLPSTSLKRSEMEMNRFQAGEGESGGDARGPHIVIAISAVLMLYITYTLCLSRVTFHSRNGVLPSPASLAAYFFFHLYPPWILHFVFPLASSRPACLRLWKSTSFLYLYLLKLCTMRVSDRSD